MSQADDSAFLEKQGGLELRQVKTELAQSRNQFNDIGVGQFHKYVEVARLAHVAKVSQGVADNDHVPNEACV